MARNKYPEETRKLILDVSAKLFLEKGYEQTSLQDIIGQLGGMTKGAIYHHFKSKEEILIAVVERLCEENNIRMARIRDEKMLSGKEKLEKMFSVSLENTNQEDVFSVTPNLLDNPRLLADYLKMLAYTVVPDYIVPVIRQGVEDGSIQTQYPEELADVVMLLSDVWLNPIIFTLSEEQLVKRVLLLNELLKPFGLELIRPDMMARMTAYRNAAARENK